MRQGRLLRKLIKFEGRKDNYAGGFADGYDDARRGTVSPAMMKRSAIEEPGVYQRGYLDGVAEASGKQLAVAPARSTIRRFTASVSRYGQ